ncbi:MAG: flavin reductase family protein [Caldilineaceae bacterium]|nr:flavin reductase family protein [Caldilineaceae bacterium]MBP8109461.1 flavin reductase family protein [Caldilineaceae bacterium]MBP8123649.1 flavin reductase family protein [Caldilineaceae bacterium]MBP9073089.1 flavin reductase family protein [Caldilineaceae bacterium]
MPFRTLTDNTQIVKLMQFSTTATLITAAHEERRTVSTNTSVMLLPTYPFRIAVGMLRENFTYELIKASGEFVVHSAGEGMQRVLVQCGTISGSSMDKFDLTRLETEPATQVKAPLVSNCYVAAECRLVEELQFDMTSLLVGEILAVHVDEQLVDLGRNPKPLIYNPRGIYKLGEQMIRGTDWLSPLLRKLTQEQVDKAADDNG